MLLVLKAYLQSSGSLSNLYHKWRDTLKHSVANIEAHIDFDETETLDHDLIDGVVKDIKLLTEMIKKHLKDGRKGEMLRIGVKTVIIGEPNVGKSSLLNLLCQRPASIVTPISGTTRDVIEVTLNIGGYPLVLADTAGLRNCSQDVIEIEGISRAKEMYEKANLVILVVDFVNYSQWHKTQQNPSFTNYVQKYVKDLGLSLIMTQEGQLEFNKECIVVLNKTDLDTENLREPVGEGVVKMSCKNEEGISDLVDNLTERLKVL